MSLRNEFAINLIVTAFFRERYVALFVNQQNSKRRKYQPAKDSGIKLPANVKTLSVMSIKGFNVVLSYFKKSDG
ncbi:hypothetical protein [Siccibacter turicensis]|uniref:hypothetical protein n=1 Tax=Siccibacter turicensis TaxID=357233 RepID=UPI000AF917B1|nr:hypothetical protein [Siccibacter turicensis]